MRSASVAAAAAASVSENIPSRATLMRPLERMQMRAHWYLQFAPLPNLGLLLDRGGARWSLAFGV